MKIIIKKVEESYKAPALNYVLRRLSKYDFHQFPTSDALNKMMKANESKLVPFVPSSEFPTLTVAEEKIINAAKACAMNEMERDFPLLQGEKVVEEFFSYLSEAFEGAKKGTAVLCQQTNYAFIYFIFDDTLIVNGKIKNTEALKVMPVVKHEPHKLKGLAGDFALSLAKGLLSGIGSEIGALICKEIFKAMGIDFFQPTEDMLKQIVQQEVTSTEINIINGQINGTSSWIKNVYAPLKNDYQRNPSKDKWTEMHSELLRYADDLCTQAIGVLEQDQFSKAGFPVYLIGVGVYFSLYQELALIDPNPADSSYAQSVKQLAQEKFANATKFYNAIITDRKAKFNMSTGQVCSCCSGYPVCNNFWYWGDSYTKQYQEFQYNPSDTKSHSYENAQNSCQVSHDAAIIAALVQLNTDLGDPNSILPAWQKLIDQPLPTIRIQIKRKLEKAL